MSTLNTTYHLQTKKDVADIKREFRNSLDDDYNETGYTIGINNRSENTESRNYMHVTTQSTFDWENDEVTVRANLIQDDRFYLTIHSTNEEFNNHVEFTLFMDNDIREQIVQALENVVIHKVEE